MWAVSSDMLFADALPAFFRLIFGGKVKAGFSRRLILQIKWWESGGTEL